MYLAGRDAHVASREALLATVWSGTVVGDDSLTQVILKLRKALGDVRDKPEYIQTIPKVGYRLVAPVVRSERTVPLPASAPARAHMEHKSRVHWLAAASVTAVVLAAVGAWSIAPDPTSISRLKSIRLSSTEAQRAARPSVTIAMSCQGPCSALVSACGFTCI